MLILLLASGGNCSSRIHNQLFMASRYFDVTDTAAARRRQSQYGGEITRTQTMTSRIARARAGAEATTTRQHAIRDDPDKQQWRQKEQNSKSERARAGAGARAGARAGATRGSTRSGTTPTRRSACTRPPSASTPPTSTGYYY